MAKYRAHYSIKSLTFSYSDVWVIERKFLCFWRYVTEISGDKGEDAKEKARNAINTLHKCEDYIE